MIATVLGWVTGGATKVYGWILLAGLVVSAFLTVYFKGRKDSTNDSRRRTLEEDLANRQAGADIRNAVAATADPVDGLREWTRPGR